MSWAAINDHRVDEYLFRRKKYPRRAGNLILKILHEKGADKYDPKIKELYDKTKHFFYPSVPPAWIDVKKGDADVVWKDKWDFLRSGFALALLATALNARAGAAVANTPKLTPSSWLIPERESKRIRKKKMVDRALDYNYLKTKGYDEVIETAKDLFKGYLLPEEVEKTAREIAPVIFKIVEEAFPEDPKRVETLVDIAQADDIVNKEKALWRTHPKLMEAIEEFWEALAKLEGSTANFSTKESAPPTKIITKKEPSEIEETFKMLKSLGVDLKLETGNLAERKAKIYAWLVNNRLITVEQEGEKVRVKPTDKMHALLAKHGGNVAAAMIKWAAEEGVGLEHVEPVARILAALEEYRQIAKEQDPALAKKLEKAMRSKHTVKELYYLLQGEYTPEELSERWSEKFGRINLKEMFTKYPELAKATLEAMGEMERKGLTAPPVPRYWLDLLQKIRDGKATKEDIEKYLAFTTYGKHVFNSLHSLAGEPLPEKGTEVEALIKNILTHNRGVAEAILARMGVGERPKQEGMDYFERNVEQLAQIIAHMKDPEHIEVVEERLGPVLAKLPSEGRRVGLFKREKSPREKVEMLASRVAELIEGRGELKEILHHGENLRRELREYIGNEADGLIDALIAPAVAAELKKRDESAEELLARVSHESLQRLTSIELKLKELRKGASNERIHDDLLRHLAFWDMPGIPTEPLEPAGRERVRKTLERV